MFETGVSSALGDRTVTIDLGGGQKRDGEVTLFRWEGCELSRDVPTAVPIIEPEQSEPGSGVDTFRGVRSAKGRFDELIGDLETVQGLLPHLENNCVPDAISNISGTDRCILDRFGEIVRDPLCHPFWLVVPTSQVGQESVGPDPAGMDVHRHLSGGPDTRTGNTETVPGPGGNRRDPWSDGILCRLVLPIDHCSGLRIPIAVEQDPALLVQNPTMVLSTIGIPF